jgi:hypothetical protein
MTEVRYIEPQRGYQYNFLSSSADIVIGGGAAGVGKTFSLLIEPIRHIHTPNFGGVIFRRTSPMIRAEGGLWDASSSLYSLLPNATAKQSTLEWCFQSGAKLKFSHLEYEKNKYDWQGSEIPFLGFDELTHFSKSMFFYLLSRNRSTCGVKPYVRATCNPDPDSWVAELLEWWIGPDGLPLTEREGVLRYFMRDNDNYIWGDSKNEVIEKGWHVLQEQVEKSGLDPRDFVKSITFIGGSIYDNKKLIDTDPAYLGNLMAQSEEEKNRLLRGNWKVSKNNTDLYDYDTFRNIFTNDFALKVNKYEVTRITTDIALKGSDKFVIFVWRGRILIDFLVMDKSSGQEIIQAINRKCYEHNVQYSNVCFDNDGVGQFVDGFIDGAVEFNNGGRAKNNENYRNLKTQCFYKSAEAVAKGHYYIPPEIANRSYDDKQTLKERLLYERKCIKRDKVDQDGKLRIIPKEQMKVYLNGQSPDLMDALAMNEVFYLISEEPEVSYE